MNYLLLDKEVQKFISEIPPSDVKTLALKKSPFKNIKAAELSQQVEGKIRAEKKLPTWFKTEGIYFASKLSIEQSSSEITAQYKNRLAKHGTLLDLTGGFGVDAYYFSTVLDEVIHCEINSELSEIVEHNCKLLGRNNIKFYTGDGINYLINTKQKPNTIYIDPSRRVKTQKVVKLADCEPDVISNLNFLIENTSRLIIKTSPLLDIYAGLKELRNVVQLHILSIKNDCKEILWIIDNDFKSQEPEVICAALTFENEETFSFKLADEKKAVSNFSLPQKYIYEPDVALLKAGAFKLIGENFGLEKLHQHTHLYTSESLKKFIGKTFELVEQMEYKHFIKNRPITKANIICRNFPQTAEQVKKKLKLGDGGDIYLFFTTLSNQKLSTLICKRIS